MATGIALDAGEAADERLSVELLELVEARAVDDPADHRACVELVAEVLGHEAVELGRVEDGLLHRRELPRRREWGIEVSHDLAGNREGVLVGGRVVVGHTGAPRVDVGAAEFLRGHVLTRRGLHERRAADEDRARPLNDHRLVRHRGDVRAPCGARAHDDRDLRDAERRQPRLIEEDPAEVVAVGEDLGLQRQESTARVDEVDAGQPVLPRDLLCPQVLLHRERVVRAALHRRVVRDDRALATLDDADPSDDPGRRSVAVVELPGGEGVQLEEGRPRIDETVDPLARRELSPRAMSFDRPSRRRRPRRARCARAAPRRGPPSKRVGARTSRLARPRT